MRKVLILALAWPLGGCLHVGLPALHLTQNPAGGRPLDQAAAPICPGGLTADIPPEPQVRAYPGAGLVQPTTPQQQAAVNVYSTFTHDYGAWARAGWARAADAKTFCQVAR